MKVNLPITNNEITFRDDQMIVSKTDLKGMITYANKDFVDISGFSELELVGKNHNMVRHPDMPTAAFKDLWDTIHAGKPWTGIVKNRAKNGDFYWVEANVSVIREGGQIVGYMSVRGKPTRKQVDEAEALYRAMRDGKTASKSLFNLFNYTKNISIKTRLLFLSLLPAIPAIALGISAFLGYGMPDYLVWASFIIGALMPVVGFNVLRATIRPLGVIGEYLEQISQGNYRNSIVPGSNNEIGRLLEKLKSMQIRLGFEVSETNRVADEAVRVNNALDCASTSMLIAGRDMMVIYANKSMNALMRGAETDIRMHLPDFSAATLIGMDVTRFYPDSDKVRQWFGSLTTSHQETLQLGTHTFRVTANPVHNEKDERLGTAVEWTDITRELKVQEDVSMVVNAVLAGDMMQRIALEDKEGFMRQLSEAMNSILDTLSKTLKRVGESARQVAAASSETSTAIGQIADGAQSQMHASQQVSVSIRQTAESVNDIATNTESASQRAKESVTLVKQGKEQMQRMLDVVNSVGMQSNKIRKITEVIERIANKTNLLSLNAAIEAARAGEHGKGFAVVAEEVGKLATSAAESTQEIAQLVNQAVLEAERAAAVSKEVNEAMDSIQDAALQSEAMLQRIAAALEEQGTAVREVKVNMEGLDKIAAANAAASEEITATVVELAKISDDTRRQVERFKVD